MKGGTVPTVDQVLGIGNAIVDVIASADDAFLDRHGLAKGTMRLVDAEQADALYAEMGPGVETSGGSAANTMAGIASLGGEAAFIGKVHDDQLGKVFRHDLRAAGVRFDTPPSPDGPPTARSLILVTPDAQRTMNTYLGASQDLTVADVVPDVVAGASLTYLEGYLWDQPAAKSAFVEAARIAHEARRRVALTLSDSFCVERFRDEFRGLVLEGVDLLFGNEDEIVSLMEAPDLDTALREVRGHCDVVAITRGARGSVIAADGETHEVPALPVDAVVDTTGAGDLFAAGVLYGMAAALPLDRCGQLGSLCAAEVISHVGARPATSLADLAVRAGLL